MQRDTAYRWASDVLIDFQRTGKFVDLAKASEPFRQRAAA